MELTAETRPAANLDVTATVTYARSWYSGLDNILRRGNYDIPLSANLTGVWRMKHALTLSWRYSVASGRPYTPDDLALSTAQNRDVYDLNSINSIRSQSYKRLDFRFEQARKFRAGSMIWHVGLQKRLEQPELLLKRLDAACRRRLRTGPDAALSRRRHQVFLLSILRSKGLFETAGLQSRRKCNKRPTRLQPLRKCRVISNSKTTLTPAYKATPTR